MNSTWEFLDADGNIVEPYPLLDPRNRAMLGQSIPVVPGEMPPYFDCSGRIITVNLRVDGELVDSHAVGVLA